MVTTLSTEKSQQVKRRAAKAGLAYVNDIESGIRRQRCGQGFTYRTPSGKTLRDERTRRRIDSLVIPPAWQDVYICTDPHGHIQAVGTDDAGRRQYIYHERWSAISSATKFDRMHLFGQRLPRIRRRIRSDLRGKQCSRQRVLAAVVRLIDKTYVRVGNQSYVKESGARGATTLTAKHVDVHDTKVSLDFPGKSGQQHHVTLSDAKVAKVVRQCEEIAGQFLFQYLDDDDQPHCIDSADVNDYLREISDEEFTAKDFRTWWGSTIALSELNEASEDDSQTARKRMAAAAVAATAEALGNTKAIARSSYIHPGILVACESGELPKLLKRLPSEAKRELTIDETRFLAILPELEFT